jgi:hypothetical protein
MQTQTKNHLKTSENTKSSGHPMMGCPLDMRFGAFWGVFALIFVEFAQF